MKVFFVLIASFLGGVLSTTAADRKAEAMTKEFTLAETATSANWTEISQYFSTPTKNEPTVPFLIERDWIEVDESDQRNKRQAASTAAPPPAQRKPKRIQGPKLVFIVDPIKAIRIMQYVYIVFVTSCSVTAFICSIFGILKTGTVVIVRNLYDENKPPRDFPATLIMCLRSKKGGKTATENTPPEKPKAEKSKD